MVVAKKIHSNPHWTQVDSANSRELGLSGGRDNQNLLCKTME